MPNWFRHLLAVQTREEIRRQCGAHCPPEHEAVDATYRGDAEPYIALWSRREPASLFGALEPRETAIADIERTFRWVASRFSDVIVSTEFEVVEVGHHLAYTVGYEHGELAIDGVKQQMRIRVTHIYR